MSDLDGSVKGIVPRTMFNEYSDHQFNSRTLMIITNYDSYLRHVLGDEMKMPPLDKQTPGHFEILDLHKSYLDDYSN